VLVLEDTGGEALHRLLGAPMDVGGFLRLAIGIATALGELHQRGLVHKDIKPANILVNGTTGEARLTGLLAKVSKLDRDLVAFPSSRVRKPSADPLAPANQFENRSRA
jgi:serine/threonine protein kinase